MDGRYEVFATHGKGVFSTVLRARDQQGGEGSGPTEVAIKMIRANETMSKAAQTEKVRHLSSYRAHRLQKQPACSVVSQSYNPCGLNVTHSALREVWFY